MTQSHPHFQGIVTTTYTSNGVAERRASGAALAFCKRRDAEHRPLEPLVSHLTLYELNPCPSAHHNLTA